MAKKKSSVFTDFATVPPTLLAAAPAAFEFNREVKMANMRLDALRRQMADAKSKGAIEMARAYVMLYKLKDDIELLSGTFKTLFEHYKVSLVPQCFEQSGVPNVPLTEGYRVGISERWTASIKANVKDQAYEWMENNGLGDLITETVNAASLAAAAKYRVEEECKDLPEQLFNVDTVKNTSVTATK